ncbi:MAG: hypothetical protein HA493_04265 [Candidatus Verstraetearchaeota archaeon]|nr:hypothetical protein [Candidatus Verstraetearchaeota archaeon]
MKINLSFIFILLSIISISGILAVVGVFLYTHPYFNPLYKQPLPKGWIDERTYVSNNFTIKNGETIRDIFQYTGSSGQSIMILGVQPLVVEKKGSIFIKFNGIPLGESYIETTYVVNTSIASCCFVTLIQAGVDNVMEIESHGFEGLLRYLIILPTK